MTTLQQAAVNYTPSATKKTFNIVDLPKVSTKVELVDDNWTDKSGKVINQQVIVINDVKYRVPKTVIEQLQTILKFAPQLEYFKVTKTGTTKDDTKYKVEPFV